MIVQSRARREETIVACLIAQKQTFKKWEQNWEHKRPTPVITVRQEWTKKDAFTLGMPLFEGENKLCKGFQLSPISTKGRL